MRMIIGVAAALLGGIAMPGAASAGDRLFANGFEPCCRIGGTVSGLTGSGLVLHLSAGATQENRPVAGNGPYAFSALLPPGTAYVLSVGSQPGAQSCSFSEPAGTIGNGDVSTADLTCGTPLQWNSGHWNEYWQ